MSAIEPHWISLLWFAACATICALAFLVVGTALVTQQVTQLMHNAVQAVV